MPFETPKALSSFQKQGILGMIGVWNQQSQHAYRKVHSDYQIDAGAGVKLRRQLNDGSFEWTCCDEIVDLYSMSPWGRIALDVEQLRIAQAMDFLSKQKAATILGVLVDAVFFKWNSGDAIPDIGLRFPDGSPVFQLKYEPAAKLPTWPRSDFVRAACTNFEKKPWRVIPEGCDYKELATVFKEHGGLMITGYAGTGKTYPLWQFLPELQKLFPGSKVLKMALRHAAAMLIGGKTIQHYLCKYRSKGGAPAPGTIVVLDEMSEVQLHTWTELARWKLVGVLLIRIGDMRGQPAARGQRARTLPAEKGRRSYPCPAA